MSNVLISLVGDQTVPNVFLVRDGAFRHIDQYVFVTSPLMEARRRLEYILASTGISGEKWRSVCVEADHLLDIARQLEQLQLPLAGNHYYVNLTSGTKLMSIALYEFFTQPGYRECSSIFYVPIGKNAYLQIFPSAQYGEHPLSYRISLKEYLDSYGIAIVRQKGQGALHQPPAYTEAFLEYMLKGIQSGKAFSLMMKRLRSSYNRIQQKPDFQFEPDADLTNFLHRAGYPVPPGAALDKAAVEYLIGGWLEEWLFAKVKQRLRLPDAAIRCAVRVRRPNAQGEAVDNECDLLFTLNNTLYMAECKSGLGRDAKQLFEETAYKMAALRGEFGQRVPAFFVTLTNLRDTKGRLRKPFLERSSMHNIRLFDRQGIHEELDAYLEGLPQQQPYEG